MLFFRPVYELVFVATVCILQQCFRTSFIVLPLLVMYSLNNYVVDEAFRVSVALYSLDKIQDWDTL